MILVVDASAAVEYLLVTALGERVGGLLEAAALAAPELLDAEVLAVLRREVLAGRLGERRAAEAVDDLRDWGIERLPHRLLLDDAWSLRGHVTAYDALYIAAARRRHAALVDDAEYRRRKTLILRHGKPSAAIVPVDVAMPARRAARRLSAREVKAVFDAVAAGGRRGAVADLLSSRR